MTTEFNLSKKITTDLYKEGYKNEVLVSGIDVEDVKEFIRLLKMLPNADGGTNCECVPNEFVEGGKGFMCEFCKGLNKLAGDKLL